jgi:hypothetical protein
MHILAHEVSRVTAAHYICTNLRIKESVVDVTGKKVTCNTITKTEQQDFADFAGGTLLSATVPKKYTCNAVT